MLLCYVGVANLFQSYVLSRCCSRAVVLRVEAVARLLQLCCWALLLRCCCCCAVAVLWGVGLGVVVVVYVRGMSMVGAGVGVLEASGGWSWRTAGGVGVGGRRLSVAGERLMS